jgi:hypothetical protein
MVEGWKEILGLTAAILGVLQAIPYTVDTLRGKTKPHLYTYIIWTIVTAIAFFGQVAAGGGPGAWSTGVMAALTAMFLVLCFRYGTGDVTKFDAWCLAGALFAIVPWLLTDDPMISIVLATGIDVLAFFPTIRKTYNDPTSETLISYISNLIRHPLSIAALATYSISTVIYPAALLFMNVVLVYVIVSRRRKW